MSVEDERVVMKIYLGSERVRDTLLIFTFVFHLKKKIRMESG